MLRFDISPHFHARPRSAPQEARAPGDLVRDARSLRPGVARATFPSRSYATAIALALAPMLALKLLLPAPPAPGAAVAIKAPSERPLRPADTRLAREGVDYLATGTTISPGRGDRRRPLSPVGKPSSLTKPSPLIKPAPKAR